MLFLMVINFYTSRVILDKLGVEGYGIYNVVGSIAIAFSFFSSSLTNATQRYVTIELGQGNLKKANQIINLHFEIFLLISIVCFIVAEFLGVYIIQKEINIPEERIGAAMWVYQFALLNVVVQLLSIPFEACVIAHEDMNLYSYMGIFEGVARLIIALLLTIVSLDKLIFYASLMFVVTCLTKLGYFLYALNFYKECFFKYYWNIQHIRESLSFVGWNIVGTGRVAVITQGMDFVLNLFLGPVGNAARGITNQVSGAIFKFSSNVLVAAQPQIVKAYANGEKCKLNALFYKTSLFSFYILWMLICPMIFYIDSLLGMWLKEVPQWAVGFTFWQLLTSLVYVLTRPLWSIIIAVGNLKKYIFWDTLTSVLLIPVAIVVLKIGFSPEMVYVGGLIIQIVNTFALLLVVNRYVSFGIIVYFHNVISRIIEVTLITGVFAWILSGAFERTLLEIILIYVLGFIFVTLVIYIRGIDKDDRLFIVKKIKSLI